jgi:hypothetical protein
MHYGPERLGSGGLEHRDRIQANIATALSRVEQAFPAPADDPIKRRTIDLISTLQNIHGTHSENERVSDLNARRTLRRRVSQFIMEHLPPSVTERPRKEDSAAEQCARLEELETQASSLRWEAEQRDPAADSERRGGMRDCD